MASDDAQQPDDAAAPALELEGSTYEIIRNRLTNHGQLLRERLDQLNEARKEVFGSIDTTLLGTERITAGQNCVPRDMVAIGDRFLFGYNVHFGLKSETSLSDVFAVYRFADQTFHTEPLDLIQDEQFQRDFSEVFRYYKNAEFARFFRKGPHLYMVIQVGKTAGDIKAFKWVVQGDQLIYVDSRSDHEVKYPPQHEFEWRRTHRDLHRHGMHPHISIDDRVFVETVGGDLTIKIENNTESGEGIYAEDVDDPDQTLDDAEIYYAIIGNIILLKIRPYQEKQFRYIVFNEKMQQARRIDSIEHACVLLPDDHGLIFANGYYLQSGEHRTFDSGLDNMTFQRRVAAPNGEDFLHVFYNETTGVSVLLRYNLIEQHVETPQICNGFTFFAGGELICFKAQKEPQKHHAIQIWQTPYVGEDYIPPTNTDSFLYKVGNKDIVRGMAECHEVLNLISKEDTYANLYLDLVKLCGDVADSYFWLDKPETFNLKEPLLAIRSTASSAVEEFEKVVRVKRNTADQTRQVSAQTREILATVHHRRFEHILEFVESLADLRRVRGDIISLRELRYVDTDLIETLETEVGEQSERLAQRCVQFLLDPAALGPYDERVEAQRAAVDPLTKVTDARDLEEQVAAGADELEMLIDIVGNLKIDDATHRTAIIDNISTIFSKINATRAALKTKIKELLSVEGVAEFNSQMKLLNQGVVNYLDICDTPDKCEEFLTKVMIQLEELEGRFAEFDEFVVQLSEKREEIYNAFETRKLSLIEARNRRAGALMNAADRILKGIKARVESLESINDIHAYFAADLMIEKVRDLVKQLEELEDSVKVDDVQSRLKTIREDAVRQLKDRQELFVAGENVIKFGSHHFNVNVQALDLTTVLRDGQMQLHLTGTNFFEPIEDAHFLTTRDVWDQEVVSENREVYRGEYLAYCLLNHLRSGSGPTSDEVLRMDQPERLKLVQQFMAPRYSEAYVKGVTDRDAELILSGLLEMTQTLGLLRYHTMARAMATIYWTWFVDTSRRELTTAKLQGYGAVARAFPAAETQQRYIDELNGLLTAFCEHNDLFPVDLAPEAAEYLFCELTHRDAFAISRDAAQLRDHFGQHLKSEGCLRDFEQSLAAVEREPSSKVRLARDWVDAYVHEHADDELSEYRDEVVGLLLRPRIDTGLIIEGHVTSDLQGLAGSHAVIQGGKYHLHYNRFTRRLANFERQVVPRYRQYVQIKKTLVDQARDQLRLDEFRPRVLTSFVRNRLIDEVYLPLIGDNLAKQMGVAGEQKRTDLMGLLLLISPPGYGKTTLMEYIANRLGIIFMKINGPAIGHHVTSLDPVEAPNASAREEVEKLNLALEMGDNVMLYLDDIQHCNPELLQKFISLCDAQRKIEGVYKGRTRTYDLRGRKVAVVMAGNPYTESGERFQIPDMLSNRADIYNLGEIIGASADSFEMSYLENSLTSNPILNRLSSRSQKDVYAIIKMAQQDQREGIDLEGNYSLEELNEMVAVMKKLMRVRDVVLQVNRQYIHSAAQSDDYRTEPAFKLQGSYRNMNRIAEKVVPIMNDDELEQLIMSNYENDAQTLTSDTESNLLKLKEMMGILTSDEARRWEDIQRTFQQNLKMKGIDAEDQVGQVVVQLRTFSDGLYEIRQALGEGIRQLADHDGKDAQQQQVGQLLDHVAGVQSSLELLGESIGGRLDRLADKQAEPAPVAAEGKADLASDALITLADELRQLTTGTLPVDPRQPVQRVSVMHKVPRSILNVLEAQFGLMQNWLEPILNLSQQQQGDIQQLRQSLEQSMGRYRDLLDDLESARSKTKSGSS